MTVTIRGRLRDALSFIAPMRERARRFRSGAAVPPASGAMNRLSEALHPQAIALRVESRREEAESVVTFRLVPANAGSRIPPFRAGQFIAARFQIRGARVSRPFSISSSPGEALRGNYYELTAQLQPRGFCSPFMFETWKPGTEVLCSGPSGSFCHEPLRDGSRIVCLAGGSGITPFKSIIADSLEREASFFTLIYGAARPEDFLFIEDIEGMARRYPGRLRVVKVCAEPDAGWAGERGLLSAGLIRAAVSDYAEATYFMCGPDAMKANLERQMEGWGLRPRQLRREGCSEAVDPSTLAGYPGARREGRLRLEARIGAVCATISADPRETVLASLERAGLDPPSLCRSGSCGWCRARLVKGEVFAPAGGDRLRAADEAYGYFHPCRSYPLSDIVMEVPRNPEGEKEAAL